MKLPLNSMIDLKIFIEKIDRSRDKSLICLIADTGLFIDELRHLSIKDINKDLTSIKTAGNRSRTLAISTFAKTHLEQWLNDRPKSNYKELFISLTGNKQPLSQRGIDNIIRKWSEVSNINFNYQKLRLLASMSDQSIKKPSPLRPPLDSVKNDASSSNTIKITRLVPFLSLCLALLYKSFKTVSK